VHGQFYILAALVPGEEPAVPPAEKLCGPQELVLKVLVERNPPTPVGNRD
jgi:hypothetical protein